MGEFTWYPSRDYSHKTSTQCDVKDQRTRNVRIKNTVIKSIYSMVAGMLKKKEPLKM